MLHPKNAVKALSAVYHINTKFVLNLSIFLTLHDHNFVWSNSLTEEKSAHLRFRFNTADLNMLIFNNI